MNIDEIRVMRNGSSINFVDRRNAVVGFDYESCCCESFWYEWRGSYYDEHWCISDANVPDSLMPKVLAGWYFDTDVEPKNREDGVDDETYWVEFVIRNRDTKGKAILRLTNCHNGYYSHGWTLKVDGETKAEGGL